MGQLQLLHQDALFEPDISPVSTPHLHIRLNHDHNFEKYLQRLVSLFQTQSSKIAISSLLSMFLTSSTSGYHNHKHVQVYGQVYVIQSFQRELHFCFFYFNQVPDQFTRSYHENDYYSISPSGPRLIFNIHLKSNLRIEDRKPLRFWSQMYQFLNIHAI